MGRYRQIRFAVYFLSALPCHESMENAGYILASRDDAKIIILGRSGRNYSVASWKIGRAIVVTSRRYFVVSLSRDDS